MIRDLQLRPLWRVVLGLFLARFRRKATWRRRLRVTLTFDLDVPDDRVLVTKVEAELRRLADRGLDRVPGFSMSHALEGTLITVHQHYENLYYEHGRFAERLEGGTRAPELKP